MKKSAKVYLVGAGPGDKGLITAKGIDCIKKADVIIYDRLVNKDLLKYRKKESEIIYVGKKSSNHILPQEEINQTILDKAKEGLLVVRLKGGDPYVFGRGGEEAESLYNENIDFEIVPGVTSAIAGLAYAGIPVTHRDFASSFHVVTGHAKKDDSLNINWKALAEEKGTVIFLMGIGNIAHISEKLIANGRRADTPVAFVSWATRHNQKTLLTSLDRAEEVVKSGQISAPALFVVGDVVKLSDKLNFYQRKLLFGKTILVTRSRSQNSHLRERLEELGSRVIEIPTIDIKKKKDINKKIRKIDFQDYNIIAFTSQNSVEYFFESLKEERIDLRQLANIKIASIGKATSETIEKYNIYPDIEAKEFTGAGLGQVILEKMGKEGNKILFPCSEIASKTFENTILEYSNKVDRLEIYQNNINTDIKEELVEVLEKEKIDYITFTSSSTFKNTRQILGEEKSYLLDELKKVSIGDITSQSIEKAGYRVDLQAKTPSIASLVEIIIKDVENN